MANVVYLRKSKADYQMNGLGRIIKSQVEQHSVKYVGWIF